MVTVEKLNSFLRVSKSRLVVGLGPLLLFLLAGRTLALSQDPIPPPAPQSTLDQAEILLREAKPSEALSLLTAAMEKNPKTSGLQAKLGKAYFQSRQFSQAAAHLKAALEENAGDLQSTQLLAISFYSLGNCREALPLLEKLGPQLPRNVPDAPYLLSICYVMTKQANKARGALARTFFVSPDSAMAYLLLGKLLVRERMVDNAIPQIETALRLEPRLTMAHFLLGEIDLYKSNYQGALAEFQQELALNPTLWLVYWRLGDAYMRLAKYDEAEKALKEAIWLNDDSPEAITLLGEIALKRNDPALASGFFERALSLQPQSLEARESLAKAYKLLGREADANQQLEIVKRLRSAADANVRDSLQPMP